MCHYQTLHHNNQAGYVIRCTECDKIQVAFGNLSMTFTPEDFEAFCRMASRIQDEQPETANRHLCCVTIAAPCPGVRLLLSAAELDELIALLDDADSELQSLQLMSLFNT